MSSDITEPILVSKLRDKLLDEYKNNTQLYDEYDVNRVKENEWTVERFLLASKMDVDHAFTLARDALRWRKSFGINDRTDLDFPLEFYKIGAFFPYNVDRKGKTVIYLRVKMHKSFPTFSEYFKQYLMHIINKIDTQTERSEPLCLEEKYCDLMGSTLEGGWVMVWDLTGSGPSNWDLSMIRFVITSFRSYYPRGLQYLMVYGVPWIMTAFVNITLSLLSEESRNKVKFANREQMFTSIAEANVPDFLGGTADKDYREVPKGARKAMDIGVERGYSVQEIESVLKFFEKFLI